MQSWKTTACGIIAGAFLYLAKSYPHYGELFTAISGVFLALMGGVAKDKTDPTIAVAPVKSADLPPMGLK